MRVAHVRSRAHRTTFAGQGYLNPQDQGDLDLRALNVWNLGVGCRFGVLGLGFRLPETGSLALNPINPTKPYIQVVLFTFLYGFSLGPLFPGALLVAEEWESKELEAQASFGVGAFRVEGLGLRVGLGFRA